jgi:hypothetical protein
MLGKVPHITQRINIGFCKTVVADPCLLYSLAPLVLCYIIMVSTYQQKGGQKCILELSSVSLALHAGNFVLNLITFFEFKM